MSQRTFDIDDPQDGATLAQDVTVVPQREGVLSLSAVVVVDYRRHLASPAPTSFP